MRQFSENLDHEQEQTLEALLAYPTKEAAAKALGISRATLYRRLETEELRQAEKEARSHAISDATATIQRLANDAANVLSVIMNNTEAPYSSRVACASKLLDMAYRSFELENVADELAELKRELL